MQRAEQKSMAERVNISHIRSAEKKINQMQTKNVNIIYLKSTGLNRKGCWRERKKICVEWKSDSTNRHHTNPSSSVIATRIADAFLTQWHWTLIFTISPLEINAGYLSHNCYYFIFIIDCYDGGWHGNLRTLHNARLCEKFNERERAMLHTM